MAVKVAIVATNHVQYGQGWFNAKNLGTSIKWLQYAAAANAQIKLVVTISARENVGWNRCVIESQKAQTTSQPSRETTICHFGNTSPRTLLPDAGGNRAGS